MEMAACQPPCPSLYHRCPMEKLKDASEINKKPGLDAKIVPIRVN
jgi:hypothetical protein